MKEHTLPARSGSLSGGRYAECELIGFPGGHIPTVVFDGEPRVIPKPVSDSLGIGWASQFAKLRDGSHAPIKLVTTRLTDDIQSRQVVTVGLDAYLVWLAGIQPDALTLTARGTLALLKAHSGRALRRRYLDILALSAAGRGVR